MNWSSVFHVLVTLTLQGTVALALVALLNLALGLFKAPRRVCALLWCAVLLRFFIPFSLPAPFSIYALEPVRQYLTPDRVTESLVGEYEAVVNGTPEFEYALAAGARPRKIHGLDFEYTAVTRQDGKLYPAKTLGGTYAPLLVKLWLSGAALCLAFGLARYGLLRRRVRLAYKAQDGVYTGACVTAPFVLGFLRPRVYLPFGLSKTEREYILLHERTHIRHGDPWLKLAFSLVVCLHWWNPLVWLGYQCLLSDLETACDQAVLRALGSEVKADYSQSLLGFATNRQPGLSTPLSFGETGVKARVKQVLRYKKPGTAAVCLAIGSALLAVCIVLTDPVAAALPQQNPDAGYREQLVQIIDELDAARQKAEASTSVSDAFKAGLDTAYQQRVAELQAYDERHAAYSSDSPEQLIDSLEKASQNHAQDLQLLPQLQIDHKSWAQQNGIDWNSPLTVTDEQAQAALAFQSGLSSFETLLYPVPSYLRAYLPPSPDENGVYSPLLIDAAEGASVYSMTDGLVVLASASPSWGNFVVVNHGSACFLYADLNQFAVNSGSWLTQGQLLGYAKGENRPVQVSFYQEGAAQSLTEYFGHWFSD